MTHEPRPIVLVHGAWHDAECWHLVQERLDGAGVASLAVQLPFTGRADDVAEVRAALDRLDEPAVLLGHSYGGLVISEAAAGRDDVAHLVYLCAFMVPAGTDPFGADPAARRTAVQTEVADDGMSTVRPESAIEAFLADVDPALAADEVARLRPFPVGSFGPIDGEPWRTVPSTYVLCTQDRAIDPSRQVEMAQHASSLVGWDTSHSPFLSRPDLVAGLLEDLARA